MNTKEIIYFSDEKKKTVQTHGNHLLGPSEPSSLFSLSSTSLSSSSLISPRLSSYTLHGVEIGFSPYNLKRKGMERKSGINFFPWNQNFIAETQITKTSEDFPPLSLQKYELKSDYTKRHHFLESDSSKTKDTIKRKQTSVKSRLFQKETIQNPNSFLLSDDFIVSSPVKDNLLLTLALQNTEDKFTSNIELNASGDRDCVYFKVEKKYRNRMLKERSNTIRNFVFLGRFFVKKPLKGIVLGYDAIKVATEPNAGGASIVSESLSMEYFSRRFGACNVVTEMEVSYINPNWKKVDYICEIYGQKFGVSVTRAMAYPDPLKFSEEKARALLHKKLYGLVIARSGVAKRHGFSKAILHVWCETYRTACLMQSQYDDMAKSLEVEDDVIMVLTIAEGNSSRPIFYESRVKDASTCTNFEDLKKKHPLWWLNEKKP